MHKVILLSDICERRFEYGSRYVGPYVLASQLDGQGIDTLVIDYFTKHPDFFNYLESFLTPEVEMIGISSTFLSPILNAETRQPRETMTAIHMDHFLWCQTADELSQWMRKLRSLVDQFNPHCKIVLGGGKASRPFQVNSEDRFAYEELDYVVFGFGDSSIIQLAQDLLAQRTPKTQEYKGFKFFNSFQFRDQRATPPSEFKPKNAVLPKETLPIEIARGCTFNCKFCHFDKNGSALKDVEHLKEELIRNYELFGTTSYGFSDDCFNDNRKKVDKVCNAILQLNFKINWTSYARADVAVKFPETLDLMVESGARGLYFGIESFNTPIAKKVGKGMPADRVKEMLLWAKKKHGEDCLFQGSFISGLPGETKESLEETMQWVLDTEALDFFSVGALTLGQFDEWADNILSDHSDFSKNPKKYGFDEVRFNPEWWSHQTMNKDEAVEMSHWMMNQWLVNHTVAIDSIWNINSALTLGFEWNEIKKMARDSKKAEFYSEMMNQRAKVYFEKYFNYLLELNPKNSQKVMTNESISRHSRIQP